MKSSLPSLGPLESLEPHVPREWWKTLFNETYLKTDGDVVENEANTRHDIDLVLSTCDLSPDDRVLDLCCGQGRHSLELSRRGFAHVVGFDQSGFLVNLARERAAARGSDAVFVEGDAQSLPFPDASFDVVLVMGNSFGYFDAEAGNIAILDQIRRVLRPGGDLVLDLTDGAWTRANYEPRSWEWIDRTHFACRERELSRDGRRLVCREIVTDSTRGVVAENFYAERLYSSDEIRSMLGERGFADASRRIPVRTESTRNQDLGMMAHRMLVTATAGDPSATLRLPRTPPRMEVVVLCGDPHRPDPVKRDGRFQPEDIRTQEIMREALGRLDGYSFRFLTRHDSLLDDLRRDPPRFVFNLCDEGFRNDPRQELHIPALLEMLGIPYSGSGPVGLGTCYDKSLVRSLAAALGVPVAREIRCAPGEFPGRLPAEFPLLVKPNFGDNSVGINRHAVVRNREELHARLRWLWTEFDPAPALVQEFLPGQEVSVGMVGNPDEGFRMFPVLSVDYSSLPGHLPPILGYESKWHPESPYWTDISYLPGDLEPRARERLESDCRRLFERLECRDYARMDFRADDRGELKLLEVNPNPGWCWDGKFNRMAEFSGLEYHDFLGLILKTALRRVQGAGVQESRAFSMVGT